MGYQDGNGTGTGWGFTYYWIHGDGPGDGKGDGKKTYFDEDSPNEAFIVPYFFQHGAGNADRHG